MTALRHLILSINDNLTSDCTASQLQDLGEFLGQYPAPTIDTIDGENVKGEEFMEFYPDESQLRQYVIDHFMNRQMELRVIQYRRQNK